MTLTHASPGIRPIVPALALAVLALAIGSGAAAADWPAGGVKMCGRLTPEQSPAIAGLPDGGAIVAWVDTRKRTETDIYAQRVTASGAIQWGTNGVPVCTGFGDQYVPLAASDGAGGAFIVWQDRRHPNSPLSLYVQRLVADGSVAPGWPAGGVAVCDTTFNPLTPYQASEDGQGGVFVTWSDSAAASLPGVNVKVQRIASNGAPAPGWPVGGVSAAVATTDQTEPELTPDGQGGVFVVWNDATTIYLQSNIVAQHLDANGVRAAGWPAGGAPVATAANGQYSPHVARDNTGGAFVVWLDRRSGTGEAIYAQRMSATGSPAWALNGLPFTGLAENHGAPIILADGAGGAVMGWTETVQIGEDEYRYDVVAQRVMASGAVQPGWPAAGFAVCTGLEGSRVLTAMVMDPTHPGSAILGWLDGRPVGPGSYRAVLTENGALAPGEQSNGRLLIGTGFPQSTPYAAPSSLGGAIMVLLKMVPNTNLYADPYTQRVFADGLVGVGDPPPAKSALAIASISPNPSRGAMRVRVHLPASAPARVALLDLAGRVRAWRDLSAGRPGEQEVALESSRPLEAGVYLVRVTQGAISAARRVAVVH